MPTIYKKDQIDEIAAEVGTRLNKRLPSDPTGIAGASAVRNAVSLSKASYDAIGSPDSATLYMVDQGDGTITMYLGASPFRKGGPAPDTNPEGYYVTSDIASPPPGQQSAQTFASSEPVAVTGVSA